MFHPQTRTSGRAHLSEWSKGRFPAETEAQYLQKQLERVVPLGRLGFLIAVADFLIYIPWDLMLTADAISLVLPHRIAVSSYLLGLFALTFVLPIKTDARWWLFVTKAAFFGAAIGLTLIFERLPGGLVAGVGSYVSGYVLIPLVVFSFFQALSVIVPYLLIPPVLIWILGGTQFEIVNNFVWGIGGAFFAAGSAYLIENMNRRAFFLEQMLAEERNRSEELLLNILPKPIADRMKAGETEIADRMTDVSVLFADIVGFTAHSAPLDAGQVVSELNKVFTEFDHLTDRYGLEKIKTIGDAYMVAAGLPYPRENHAIVLTRMALDMLDVVERLGKERGDPFQIRVGIHSGPVVAGIIGERRFSYDLWGDTVNTASRMEAYGEPGKIQITAATLERIKGHFICERRGEIDLKGLGSVETWFVARSCTRGAKSVGRDSD